MSRNNGEQAGTGDIVVSGIVGGGLNLLFGASGREITNAVGNTVKTVGDAVVKNTIRSVTNKTGKFVLKKAIISTAENLISSSVQGGFGKIFTLVGTNLLEAFR